MVKKNGEKNKNRNRDDKKIEDKFFKQTIPGINRLLKKLGINHTIVKLIPNEFLSYGDKSKRMDLSGLIDDNESTINLEFKANYPSIEEIENTLEYAIFLRSKYGKKVYSYIISTMNKEDTEYKIEWHNTDDYKIPLITLKKFDGDETIETIQRKIDNGEEILDDDLTDITAIAFMNSSKSPKELLIESIRLINQINPEDGEEINLDEITYVKNLLRLLAIKFTDSDEEFKEISRMIKMNGGLAERVFENMMEEAYDKAYEKVKKESNKEVFDEGYEKAKKEAKEEKYEIAKEFLKIGYTLEKIKKITKLETEEIQKLKNEG